MVAIVCMAVIWTGALLFAWYGLSPEEVRSFFSMSPQAQEIVIKEETRNHDEEKK